ncbi:MAG TPA: arginine deiminase-related protein [Woeseiaceae bacterium]|jgi:hypothetical protein|nr:arginine deiminase-related protein [Woeseiaceae bacterium]
MTLGKEAQLASAVLMIRPVRFESNSQTAASNRFQGKTGRTSDELQAGALGEFERLRQALEAAGVRVLVFDDVAEPHTPDAVFPNNWVSFHSDGTVVLYPMEAENRRLERREDIVEALPSKHGFLVREIVDLTHHEAEGHYLEGTGSLVLDRVNHVAYACLSSRTHLDPLGELAQRLDYDVVTFDAVDRNGAPIYHTNVLMNIGEELAVACAQAIPRETQRAAVIDRLEQSGRRVMQISYAQLHAFAGNMLELRSRSGKRVVALSQQALDSLTAEQRDLLNANGDIVAVPIDVIEASAGGSVRCMLAEIHLPTA